MIQSTALPGGPLSRLQEQCVCSAASPLHTAVTGPHPQQLPYWGSRWTLDGSQGGQSPVLVQDDKLERFQVGFQGQGTEAWAGSKWEDRN